MWDALECIASCAFPDVAQELNKSLAVCEKELVAAHQEKAEAIEASRRARAEVEKLQAALDAQSAAAKEIARANKANVCLEGSPLPIVTPVIRIFGNWRADGCGEQGP